MEGLISKIASMGWGSGFAHQVAGRFSVAAAQVRARAEALATEAGAHADAVKSMADQLADITSDSWKGPAREAYLKQNERRSDECLVVSGQLAESGDLLRQAGQEIAEKLEGYAAQALELGAAFDAALNLFASAYEKAEDVLDNLWGSPLAGTQQAIENLADNSLLRFAESLG